MYFLNESFGMNPKTSSVLSFRCKQRGTCLPAGRLPRNSSPVSFTLERRRIAGIEFIKKDKSINEEAFLPAYFQVDYLVGVSIVAVQVVEPDVASVMVAAQAAEPDVVVARVAAVQEVGPVAAVMAVVQVVESDVAAVMAVAALPVEPDVAAVMAVAALPVESDVAAAMVVAWQVEPVAAAQPVEPAVAALPVEPDVVAAMAVA